jgi:hypothetical protein
MSEVQFFEKVWFKDRSFENGLGCLALRDRHSIRAEDYLDHAKSAPPTTGFGIALRTCAEHHDSSYQTCAAFPVPTKET